MKKYTYSKKDFKQFKASVIYWLDKFGITEWEYEIVQRQLDVASATTTYNNKSKLACFQLTHNIEYDFCLQADVGRLALHEVLHLLLADFGYAIQETKEYDSDLAIAQEHAVVMRMMKALAK